MSLKNFSGGGSGNKDYENPPLGSHAARCIQIVSLGTHTKNHPVYGIKTNLYMKIVWELSPMDDNNEYILMEDGRPFICQSQYTVSLADNSHLCKMLVAWRGKPISDEEKKEFDFSKLLDRVCQVTLVETKKEDKSFINVSAVAPLHKAIKCMERQNDLLFFDIDEIGTPKFAKVYPSFRKKILESKEAKEGGFTEENTYPYEKAKKDDASKQDAGDSDGKPWD